MLMIDGVEYLVEKEVAMKYGRSVHWFRKARYTHQSPKYYKINGKVFYTIKDIDAWLKDHMKSVTT